MKINYSQAEEKTHNWLISILANLIYLANSYIASQGIQWPFLMETFVIAFILFLGVTSKIKGEFLISIIFLILFGFPEYLGDPYLDVFFQPFYYIKYVLILGLILMMKPRPSQEGLILMALIIISTLLSIVMGYSGAIYDELPYLILFLLLLNSVCRSEIKLYGVTLLSLIEGWIFISPLTAILLDIGGLYDLRLDQDKAYFYGHWFTIALCISIFRAVSYRSSIKIPKFTHYLLLMIVYVINLPSIQSTNYLFLLSSIFFGYLARKKNVDWRGVLKLTIVTIIISSAAVNLIYNTIEPGGWAYFKIQQLYNAGTGNLLENSNSLLIRISELLSLIEQGNFFTILFGRGLSSTYLAVGDTWQYIVFHHATFPEGQITSGIFQYIHESPVMLFKWAGLIGVIFFLLYMKKEIHHSRDKIYTSMIGLFYFMTFCASLHTAFLVTFLFALCKRSSDD